MNTKNTKQIQIPVHIHNKYINKYKTNIVQMQYNCKYKAYTKQIHNKYKTNATQIPNKYKLNTKQIQNNDKTKTVQRQSKHETNTTHMYCPVKSVDQWSRTIRNSSCSHLLNQTQELFTFSCFGALPHVWHLAPESISNKWNQVARSGHVAPVM